MYAVVRVNLNNLDLLQSDIEGSVRVVFSVKEVTADQRLAETEAERLNRVNGEKGYYYFVDLARVADSSTEHIPTEI
jgi:hypothetical protein